MSRGTCAWVMSRTNESCRTLCACINIFVCACVCVFFKLSFSRICLFPLVTKLGTQNYGSYQISTVKIYGKNQISNVMMHIIGKLVWNFREAKHNLYINRNVNCQHAQQHHHLTAQFLIFMQDCSGMCVLQCVLYRLNMATLHVCSFTGDKTRLHVWHHVW